MCIHAGFPDPSLLTYTKHENKSWFRPNTRADLDSFVKGNPTLTLFFFCFVFFLVDEGRRDSNTTISGPSSTRQ